MFFLVDSYCFKTIMSSLLLSTVYYIYGLAEFLRVWEREREILVILASDRVLFRYESGRRDQTIGSSGSRLRFGRLGRDD